MCREAARVLLEQGQASACVKTLAAYAEKLVATPSGRRRRSSKRVTPWKLTFSVTMLMLLRPLSCAAHAA